MKDQHEKIKGYRDLTQEEIDLMNEVKDMGVELDQLIKKCEMFDLELSTKTTAGDMLESDSFRWRAIAKTSLQQGIMALTQA